MSNSQYQNEGFQFGQCGILGKITHWAKFMLNYNSDPQHNS